MKNITKIIWGVVLLAVGIIIALNAMGITNIDVLFPGWWTLFIIIPCLVGIITERDKVGNIIGLCIGVVLLLSMLGVIEFSIIWKLIFPAAIIVVAICLIVRGFGKTDTDKMLERAREDGEIPSIFAAFSGRDVNYDGRAFDGAELSAIFGGVKCDLKGAVIEKDCVIKVSSIFGGIDIIFPDNVNVKVDSVSIFGGVSDKTVRRSDAVATVHISGLCLFGGVDLK